MAVVLLVAAPGCKGKIAGKVCANDDICGPGYDCFRGTCVAVCTRDEECAPTEHCHRYHCEAQDGGHAAVAAPAVTPKAPTVTGPTADVIAAELRAIRRELELVRRDQNRILDLLGAKGSAAPPQPHQAPGTQGPP